MMTSHSNASTQHWMIRFLPLRTLKNAQELAHRFRDVEGFRLYVQERAGMVLADMLVIVLISFACGVGVVVFLGDRHSLLALLGILLMPLALVGSFFVMTYVYFSWIEGRALAQELGRRHGPPPGTTALWLSKKFGLDMGPVPAVPWLLAALVLFLPLVLLAAAWLSAALIVILLGVLVPVVFAKFDNQASR